MKLFKLSLLALAATALVGCSTIRPNESIAIREEAKVTEVINKSFTNVPAPANPPITVAVY